MLRGSWGRERPRKGLKAILGSFQGLERKRRVRERTVKLCLVKQVFVVYKKSHLQLKEGRKDDTDKLESVKLYGNEKIA